MKIANAHDVFTVMQEILLRNSKIGRRKERFWAIGLENNNTILYIELVSLGTLKATLVSSLDVFNTAVRRKAAALILVHNHPSGEMRPSKADVGITNKLVDSGRLLECQILDHVIISETKFYSFKDEGML